MMWWMVWWKGQGGEEGQTNANAYGKVDGNYHYCMFERGYRPAEEEDSYINKVPQRPTKE